MTENSKLNVEVLIKELAPEICDSIHAACKQAKSETELQQDIEHALKRFREDIGLEESLWRPLQDVGIGYQGTSQRIDSYYRNIFIEYKQPRFYARKGNPNYQKNHSPHK